MRDQANNLTFRPVIVPAANTDLGTTPLVGSIIDRRGYESLTYGWGAARIDETLG